MLTTRSANSRSSILATLSTVRLPAKCVGCRYTAASCKADASVDSAFMHSSLRAASDFGFLQCPRVSGKSLDKATCVPSVSLRIQHWNLTPRYRASGVMTAL
jgi:hypothetical protein